MKISIIAAIGKNRELGKNNDLIWKIPEDLKRFREKTRGHAVIMGRKTWDSLPIRPLPNRLNIVVSRKENRLESGATVVFSLEKALGLGREYEKDKFGDDKGEVFIIGGGQIFKQAIDAGIVDKLYLTIVDSVFHADIFFPEYKEFKREKAVGSGEYNGHKYQFINFEK